MTTTRLTVDAAQHREAHGLGACCWLCSDQVPWWREARIKAGYGETPPFCWERMRQMFYRSKVREF